MLYEVITVIESPFTDVAHHVVRPVGLPIESVVIQRHDAGMLEPAGDFRHVEAGERLHTRIPDGKADIRGFGSYNFV